jgi:CBS domain-containing protein
MTAEIETLSVEVAQAQTVVPLRVRGQADFFTTSAGEVMTRSFVACQPEDLLSEVLTKMHDKGLVHVLVIDASNKPVGILNERDGLRALLTAGNVGETLLRNYVMGVGYQ